MPREYRISSKQVQRTVNYLAIIIWAGAAVILFLVAVGIAISTDVFIGNIIAALFINFVSILIAAIIYFLLFKRKRLRILEPEVGEHLYYLIPQFYMADWNEIMARSSSVSIVTNYFDTWAVQNRDSVTNFIKKNGNFEIFLPNPENEELLEIIVSLYPDFDGDKDILKEKIIGTKKKLLEYAKDAGGYVNIFWIDVQPNYFLFSADEREFFLSPYEQFRNPAKKVVAPIAIFNSEDDPLFKDFWMKELTEFRRAGMRAV